MNAFFRPVVLVNEQKLSMDGVQRVSISYITERITVIPSEGAELVLREYFNDDAPERMACIVQDEEGISIRNGERMGLMNFFKGYVELHLPKAYFGVLNVKSISGKLEVPGRLVLSELTMSSTSGRIEASSVTAGTAVLSSVSGGLEVGNLEALANLHSTSGSIRVGSAAGDGEYRSVSGSIDVSYQAVTGDITASTISGRVRLQLPALLSFTLDAHTVSGRVDVAFQGAALTGGKHALVGTVGNAPQVRVNTRTVSGRIEVLPQA